MCYEYEVAGRMVTLEEDPDVIAVRFREPAPQSRRVTAASRNGLGPFAERFEVPEEKYTLLPVSPTPQPRERRAAAALSALGRDREVARAAPVFRLGEARVFASERIMVGFKDDPGDTPPQVAAVGGEVVFRRGKELVVRVPEDADPLRIATSLAADDAVAYAEPDFVTIGRHLAQPGQERGRGTLDAHAEQQYALRITRAVEAWRLQMGSPAVTIAILDEGVDTRHEDLAAAVTGTYDGIDDDEFQEPKPWNAHGTACAGLAAAVHNQVGVKGIGGGCSLMAVRIAYSAAPGGDWVCANTWVTRAIDWAWEHGADILSNSWGGGAPSTAIINAFERARTQGRNGKGCVVLAAAGNYQGNVIFPASLSGVMAVSASNEYDEFKTKSSRDGEHWWGSCFGPEVDVAAPGVHNWTTDITGQAGYTPGNYTSTFNGTSSATPIVAGCAGLILSANPDLDEEQVRQIITETADKVGGYPYHDGRNDQMGYGRLNVLNAVRAALRETGELEGTIRQIGTKAPHAGAFYLLTDDGGTFLLRHYHGYEAVGWEALENQSLAYFSRFCDRQVHLRFSRRQQTAHGIILWGATVVQHE